VPLRWLPAAALSVLPAIAGAQSLPPPISIDRTELVFGTGTVNGAPLVTPAQRVFLESPGGPSATWTAVVDRPWLTISPASGQLPARLTITVDRSHQASGDEGHVAITSGSGEATSIRILLKSAPPNAVAIGSLDVPADRAVVEGSVRFFGWALHPIGLSRLLICREQAPAGRHAVGADDCGRQLTLIGEAQPYYLPRPDVAAAMPDLPRREDAGWTYVLNAETLGKGTLGTMRVHVVALGLDGSRAVIASRTITIMPAAVEGMPPRLRTIIIWLIAGLMLHLLLGGLVVRRLPDVSNKDILAVLPVSVSERLTVAGVVVAAFAMSLPAMRASLTYDELYLASLYAVGVPIWKAALEASTFIHIAYAVAAAVSVRLLGGSELALRLPAALLGAGGIYLVWRYARPLIGRGAAVMAALILALLPFHAHWSRMAKGYTGLSFATLLALHGFSMMMQNGSRRHAVEHAAGLALGLYFHLYAVWVFLVQYALFAGFVVSAGAQRTGGSPLTRANARALWWSFLAGGLCAVTLYAPVASRLLQPLAYFGEQVGGQPGLVRNIYLEFAGLEGMWSRIAVGVLAAVGAVAMWRRSPIDALQSVLLIVVPVAVIAGIVQPRASGARYFGYWAPVLALLVASALTAIAGGWKSRSLAWRAARLAAAAALAIGLAAGWISADRTIGPRDGYGEKLAPLNDPPRSAVYSVGADSEMFRYYVQEPLRTFTSADELEFALRTAPVFRVAYHGVPWNSPEQVRMRELLDKRCPGSAHGIVTIYQCGG